MNNWIDKHSINCYFCGELADERDCLPADEYNGGDGGDICPKCIKEKENDDRCNCGESRKEDCRDTESESN